MFAVLFALWFGILIPESLAPRAAAPGAMIERVPPDFHRPVPVPRPPRPGPREPR